MHAAGCILRRDELVDGHLVQSRFAESVARKPHRVAEGCPMCEKITDRATPSLALTDNDYPFAEGHLLAITPRHSARFESKEWKAALQLARDRRLAIAYQEQGSGATLPQHAHLSMFDDRLPILQHLPRPSKIGAAACYPGFAIQAPFDARFDGPFLRLRSWFARHRVSINVLGDPHWGWLMIPRRSLRAVTGRRLGSVELGGIFIANLEGYSAATGTKIDHLLRGYETLDLRLSIAMIRDVTYPSDGQLVTAALDLVAPAGHGEWQ